MMMMMMMMKRLDRRHYRDSRWFQTGLGGQVVVNRPSHRIRRTSVTWNAPEVTSYSDEHVIAGQWSIKLTSLLNVTWRQPLDWHCYRCGISSVPTLSWFVEKRNTRNEPPYSVRACRGLGGAPLTWAKPLFFGQKLIFFGQKPAAKSEKTTFLYLLNDKNGIHSVYSKINCPKCEIF